MTVTISGHIIKKTEIVGIGPLMSITKKDQFTNITFEYSYILHMRHNSTTIQRTWKIPWSHDNTQRAAIKAETEAWADDYEKAKNTIIEAIHADLP